MKGFVFFLIAATLWKAWSQIPCDDAYGAHCPEESSWGVGDCLKKLESLSQDCSEFVKLHDECKSEIDSTCSGKEYTADVLPCLTEWNQISLSTSCQKALPQKKENNGQRESDKVGSDAKRKADQRRRIRNKAARRAREGPEF